jgi:autotransporter passenger strand-loop-strand repeat protein
VIQGGTASAVQVLSLSYQYISGDDTGTVGLAVSTTIGSGGEVIVDSGGVASAMAIGKFSNAQVYSGGTAFATMVGSDSLIDVEAGGLTTGTILSAYGAEEGIGYGGVASDTTISSGGDQIVSGSAVNATVQAGGTQGVQSGGTAHTTNISGGGIEVVQAGGYADGGNADGGNLYVSSGGTASDIYIRGGFTDLGVGAIATDNIVFVSGGILQIDGTTMPAATISGFAPGEMIDLTGLNASGVTYTLRSGNVLHIVVAGGQSYDLDFDPSQNLAVGQFEFNAGASGGIQIAVAAQTTVASGTFTVQSGQIDAGVTVSGNGLLVVDSGGTLDGTVVDSGGTVNDSAPRRTRS